MIISSAKIRGHRCFKHTWAGFDLIKPINVIIGRNNTGKSHLLDLVEALCSGNSYRHGWQYRCKGVLDEIVLKRHFPEHTFGGPLNGNHWIDHGRHFIGAEMEWETNESGEITNLALLESANEKFPTDNKWSEGRHQILRGIAKSGKHELSGSAFSRLLADRDIRPELASNNLVLLADGSGATNIVRRYIVSSSPQFQRDLIQKTLLGALNEIFSHDGRFTEIQVQTHDEDQGITGYPQGSWEIFLGEEKKGLIALSRSGSGLKTVFLVLLNLLVIPDIKGVSKNRYLFTFEELENNLHPALLRRLLQFLENYALTEGAIIFLTTHSSTALDIFGLSQNAQIVHVTHDGESARTTISSAHFDLLSVVSELGAKPSDLLQANGIIWVEGPSDCVYINRWIDLYTGGRLKEGRDYQCAFYGGALLARTQFVSPEAAERDVINLFRINTNIVVVCDGDRAEGARVKDRVRRIRSEVRCIPHAHIWVTSGREIENYIPGAILSKAMQTSPLPDPSQYEPFFPRKRLPGLSYIESRLRRKSLDKMDLAVLSVPHMSVEVLRARFDWEAEIRQIVAQIDLWNT